MDPETGVFGFLDPKNVQFAFINLGLIAGFSCFILQGFIVKEFSSLVMCTVYIAEPFFGQIFGCILWLDKVPGILSGLGCLITFVGMFYVGLGTQRRKDSGNWKKEVKMLSVKELISEKFELNLITYIKWQIKRLIYNSK